MTPGPLERAHNVITVNRALPPSPPAAGEVYHQQFRVAYEYPVHFTTDVFDPANPCLVSAVCRQGTPPRPLVVVVDAGAARAWPGFQDRITAYVAHHHRHLRLLVPPLTVPGGEAVKADPEATRDLGRRLLAAGADRHTAVAAVGGGAMLDFVGFVAATVHRGLRLVRLPSTVLAQNDSGVGVKTSVNAFGVKNFLGTFTPPYAVINDLGLLATLEERDKRAGMAEAVKVALIRDPAFFAWLEDYREALAAFEPAAMHTLIRRCAELHMEQIAGGGDPFERGSARPLDYGHWAAHRLESSSAYGLRHGEAVAVGMALDTRYAVEAGLLGEAAAARVMALLGGLGFALWHPHLEPPAGGGPWPLLDGLEEFREHLGGELSVILLADIGSPREVHAMDPARLAAAARWLSRHYGP